MTRNNFFFIGLTVLCLALCISYFAFGMFYLGFIILPVLVISRRFYSVNHFFRQSQKIFENLGFRELSDEDHPSYRGFVGYVFAEQKTVRTSGVYRYQNLSGLELVVGSWVDSRALTTGIAFFWRGNFGNDGICPLKQQISHFEQRLLPAQITIEHGSLAKVKIDSGLFGGRNLFAMSSEKLKPFWEAATMGLSL